MLWEDDVWYLELVLYPPSTDDAYKIITETLAGTTTRWQMMRHWNVINPGDHDHGMDDVKGPEQIVIRNRDGLGQDAEYMRRNFQIVHHLGTGAEEVDPLANPKKWRAWKMPNRDFTFVVLAMGGIVLGAAYMLWMLQRVALGEPRTAAARGLTDLSTREIVTVLPLAIAVFGIGIYPGPFLEAMDSTVIYVVDQFAQAGLSQATP